MNTTFKTIVSSFLIVISAVSVSAANPKGSYNRVDRNLKYSNYFDVYANLGYNRLMNNSSDYKTYGGVGAGLGFAYEFLYKGFLLTTGVEVQYLQSSGSYNIGDVASRYISDTQNKTAICNYIIQGESHDTQHMLYTNIPIMIGGYSSSGFYGCAGVKIGYSPWAQNVQKLNYETTADYQQYIEPFTDMANHGYTTHSAKASTPLDAKWKFAAAGELGYDLLGNIRSRNHTQHYGLKIALVAEYQINNTLTGQKDTPLYEPKADNATELNLHPYYASKACDGLSLHNLFVGVKVGFLFCVKTPGCDCEAGEKTFRIK